MHCWNSSPLFHGYFDPDILWADGWEEIDRKPKQGLNFSYSGRTLVKCELQVNRRYTSFACRNILSGRFYNGNFDFPVIQCGHLSAVLFLVSILSLCTCVVLFSERDYVAPCVSFGRTRWPALLCTPNGPRFEPENVIHTYLSLRSA